MASPIDLHNRGEKQISDKRRIELLERKVKTLEDKVQVLCDWLEKLANL